MLLTLIGLCCRLDLAGVTSYVRVLGLRPALCGRGKIALLFFDVVLYELNLPNILASLLLRRLQGVSRMGWFLG
jgi:hypothetical protein